MDNRTQTSKAKFFCGGKNLPHFFRRPADILSTCSHDELLRKCATPKELNAPDLFERQLMDIFEKIKNVLVRRSYPETEFGLQPMEFFVALLRTCPEGSRLTFDQSEPASFVIAFREWSHRTDINTFEADYYTIDPGFIALVDRSGAKNASGETRQHMIRAWAGSQPGIDHG